MRKSIIFEILIKTIGMYLRMQIKRDVKMNEQKKNG